MILIALIQAVVFWWAWGFVLMIILMVIAAPFIWVHQFLRDAKESRASARMWKAIEERRRAASVHEKPFY